MKKLIAAAVLTVASATASATPFYFDLNDGGATPTVELDRLAVVYNSFTSINTATGAVETYGGIDLIGETFGGLIGAPYSAFDSSFTSVNLITSQPSSVGEYFTSNFALSFGLSLTGTFDLVNGIKYTGGTIDLYKYELTDYPISEDPLAVDNQILLMSTAFSSEKIVAGEQIVTSLISDGPTQITAAGEDTFFFDRFGTLVSFEDYLASFANQIRMTVVQTVSVDDLVADVLAGGVATDGTTVVVTDDHTADVKFEVPEPATLAVLGLGLLGLGAAGRRRAA